MAYFPNGTSGMVYQGKYCENCWNWRDLNDDRGPGCPIWDWHLIHSYDQIAGNKANDVKVAESKVYKDSLEQFIPTGDDGFPKQCLMFLPKNEIDIPGQLKLFETP